MKGHDKLVVILVELAIILGQQSMALAHDQSVKSIANETSGQTDHLTVDGVIAMAQAGLSDDLIIARLREEKRRFNLSASDMIRLKKAKVSDRVVKAMLEPNATTASTITASSEAPAPAPPAQPPPPVVQQSSSPQPHGVFQQMFQGFKQGLRGPLGPAGPAQQNGPQALAAAGLKNILPQFDPDESVSKQFPHVAVTVLKAPPDWGFTELGQSGYFKGCFTLHFVIWSDAQHSRTVGPIDWCSPRDLTKVAGPQYSMSLLPLEGDEVSSYLTGIQRTDGPRPPSRLLPNDKDTIERGGNLKDFNLDGGLSRLSAMFLCIRYDLGANLYQAGDFRVWIVRINE